MWFIQNNCGKLNENSEETTVFVRIRTVLEFDNINNNNQLKWSKRTIISLLWSIVKIYVHYRKHEKERISHKLLV